MSVNFRYIKLADRLEKKIMVGDFRTGEKLPSIRKLHRSTGLSISTVYQALIELEKRNLVETRPKSGFYIKPLIQKKLSVPDLKKYRSRPHKVSIHEMASQVQEAMGDENFVQLGGAVLSPELLPMKMIMRAARTAVNSSMATSLSYSHSTGLSDLRRQIANKMIGVTGSITTEEIIITNGCTDAVTLCLRAVTKPGDIIAIESPTFFGFLRLLEDLKLKALEVPTHPIEGINLEYLETALKKHSIKALLIVPNISNPLGYAMPDKNKYMLVKMLHQYDIPIIEDGIYSDLSFDGRFLTPLKSYDRKGLVLYCSSISKTLAPGLRIGWVVPGRFAQTIKRMKLNSTVMSPALNQQIVTMCLKTGFYDRHIRKLRNALKIQMSSMIAAIAKYFPKETKLSSPAGGYLLWVQLSPGVDSFTIYQKALEKKITILPGCLCSSFGRHRECIRLNCGLPWNNRISQSVAALAELVTSYCSDLK
jgi:DNA-binding transcriptional MocR family regulator